MFDGDGVCTVESGGPSAPNGNFVSEVVTLLTNMVDIVRDYADIALDNVETRVHYAFSSFPNNNGQATVQLLKSASEFDKQPEDHNFL